MSLFFVKTSIKNKIKVTACFSNINEQYDRVIDKSNCTTEVIHSKVKNEEKGDRRSYQNLGF